jgi:uncharacterized protein involved in exopolysaccharide biosynthesis
MDELAIRPNGRRAALPLTLRDIAMPIFRQRRLVSLLFLGIFLGAVLSGLLLPRKYQAEMKILVNRDRVDAVVTPDPSAAEIVSPVMVVSEEDLNSEVELLKSHDLLEKVVLDSGLQSRQDSAWSRTVERVGDALRGSRPTPQTRIARSVQALDDRLVVEPLSKTTLIRVAYTSRDPELSARVLQNLARFYLEKHAAVHRPAGTFNFFDQQTNRYREELAAAEARLTDFDSKEGVAAPAVQKQLALQQLSQFEADLQRERSSAYAAGERARALQAQETVAPQRQTTQVRKLDNAKLLADLQSTLVSLELRHSDLLQKYQPSYPPVRTVETQIAKTRAAITQARQSHIGDVTTDRVPAQDWMATELAKARADRAEFQAQAAATARVVRRYKQIAQQLDRKGVMQGDLTRSVKSGEDNYLLYLHKREEARISDALDSKRIVNVSIAEAATVPALATLHLGWLLIGVFFTAGILSVGSAYAVDRMDPSFRTPEELGRYLDLKVLASIPAGALKQ